MAVTRALTHEPHWELEHLARATRLADWMFEQFASGVGPSTLEVGAGTGTFSERLLASPVERLVLVEPDRTCVDVLETRFGGDPRVRVVCAALPDATALAAETGSFDFALCQNVLEHVDEDAAAVTTIAHVPRPGGRLSLLVPAHPRLFGSLDRAFAHRRRYTRERLRRVVEGAGLSLTALYSFNLLGVPGWWAKGRSGSREIGAGPLAAYEALVRVWRPVEERLRPPWGLSLVAHAAKP